MENLEKPLTWVLVIALLGYLFTANYDYGEAASYTANNDFNIDFKDDTVNVKQEISGKIEDEILNVDSIVDAVLEGIEMSWDGETDSICRLLNLTDEQCQLFVNQGQISISGNNKEPNPDLIIYIQNKFNCSKKEAINFLNKSDDIDTTIKIDLAE